MHNCGVCGHDCLGGDCLGNVCGPHPILGGSDPSVLNIKGFALATDPLGVATGIFYLAGGNATTNGAVMFVSFAAPLVHNVVLGNQCGPISIAANATDVYWVNSGTCAVPPDGGGDGEVGHAAIDGTNAHIIHSYQQAPTVVVASSGGYAWLTAGDATVNVVPKGAGTAKGYSLNHGPLALAADPTWLYWTDIEGQVTQMHWDGTQSSMLPNVVDASPNFIAPAVGALGPYWTDSDAGDVYYYDGTSSKFLAADGAPQGIASDGAGVYWADPSTGTVFKSALTGGTPGTLATGQMQPITVLTDSVSVFWLNTGGGAGSTVMRLAK